MKHPLQSLSSRLSLVAALSCLLMTTPAMATMTANPDTFDDALQLDTNMLNANTADLTGLNFVIDTGADYSDVSTGLDFMYADTDNFAAMTFALDDQDDQTLIALITAPAAGEETFILSKFDDKVVYSVDNTLVSGAVLALATGTDLADALSRGSASNLMGGAGSFVTTVTLGDSPQ